MKQTKGLYFSAGRWYYDVRDDEGRLKRFTSTKLGKEGQNEVKKKANAWLTDHSPSQGTVETLYPRFLKWYGDYKNHDEQLRTLERVGRLYIIPQIGKLRVSLIKYKTWQSVLDGATKENGELPAEKTLKQVRDALTQFVRYCSTQEECCEPLAYPLMIPPRAEKSKEREILSQEDIHKLFHECDGWYINLFRLGVVTGLRPGELIALTRQDVDLAAGTIHIQRAKNGHGKITQGKNKHANRVFGLSSIAVMVLREQFAKTEHLHVDWIFPTKVGDVPSQMMIWKAYHATGLPGSPYSLRHTFVSLMKNDVPLSIIKSVVGHSVVMPTLEVYGHQTDQDAAITTKLVDEALKKSLE